jgi:hypothetical protein
MDFDITDQQTSDCLHSSDTREKMEIQWDSTSAIHRLQESLSSNEDGSIVQHSHRA